MQYAERAERKSEVLSKLEMIAIGKMQGDLPAVVDTRIGLIEEVRWKEEKSKKYREKIGKKASYFSGLDHNMSLIGCAAQYILMDINRGLKIWTH
jgi:hypothetical protein